MAKPNPKNSWVIDLKPLRTFVVVMKLLKHSGYTMEDAIAFYRALKMAASGLTEKQVDELFAKKDKKDVPKQSRPHRKSHARS